GRTLLRTCRWFVFFFQAEDGIRDGHVTGVQTCALPISFRVAAVSASTGVRPAATSRLSSSCSEKPGMSSWFAASEPAATSPPARLNSRTNRSEERRVGKECRSRGGAGHEKKNKEEDSRQR